MGIFYTKTSEYNGELHTDRVIVALIILVVTLTLISWFIYPHVRVYKQNLAGEANLRQQEWEKKIAIESAKALKESAKLQADAEIERARGIAEANKIISDSLKDNEAYLRYLWIDKLSDNQNVIYVPTEAGLPILEAGKR